MTHQLYDIDLERTLLASLIFEPNLINDFFHQLNLQELCFHESHQVILKTILNLHSNGVPVEEGMINNTLKKNGHLVENELVLILTATPVATIRPYIDSLGELSNKRQLTSLIHSFNHDLHNESIASAALLSKTLEKFENFRQTHRVELFETHDIVSLKAEEAIDSL